MEGRQMALTPVWITDAAVVSALGNDLPTLWENLLQGRTGIKPVQRFPVDGYHSRYAACIEDLPPRTEHSMAYALLDRLFQSMPPVPPDARLITATTKAGIDALENVCRGMPADPHDLFPAHLSRVISHRVGLKGQPVNINAACASSTIAVAEAATWIALGRADAVLVCCFDLVTEFIFSGFSALQAMSPEPCRPFDRDRDGLTIGEGAAALMLMHPEKAEKQGRLPLGSIRGWSVTNDATHITAPARDACGLIQAMRGAMQMAGLRKEDIADICFHGTGTIYNDLMELTACAGVFGERNIPVYSVKGAIGHTMAAAGGIEVALCLKSLGQDLVPPTKGFSSPEKGAEGRVFAEPIAVNGNYVLTTNSGFGGVNAAIVLKKEMRT